MQLRDLLNKNSVKDLKNRAVSHSFKRAKRTANRNIKEKHSKLAKIRMDNMLTIDETAKLCGVRKSVVLRWETTGTNRNDTMPFN